MKCSSKTRRSIGFIFVLSVAVVMMIGVSAGAVKADPFSVPVFDPGNFPDPPDISNPFLTLIPGTAFCYEAETEDGTETNEVTVVTDDGGACTLEIAGVKTIVVRDAVRLDDVLTEDTYDLYACDEEDDECGNVWYLGEATKECGPPQNTEGTWNANQCAEDYCGGEPGIVMLANPMPGNSYQQEFLEDVAEDLGKVLRLDANVSVPYGDFEDCLKTKEWTPLATGNLEHKYYARNIAQLDPDTEIGGLVLVEGLKGKTVRTELFDVLTDVASTGACPTSFADALDKLCDEVNSPPPMNCD